MRSAHLFASIGLAASPMLRRSNGLSGLFRSRFSPRSPAHSGRSEGHARIARDGKTHMGCGQEAENNG